MNIVSILQNSVIEAVQQLYGETIQQQQIPTSPTRKEIEGDYTITVFPFAKLAKKAPAQVAEELGAYLSQQQPDLVATYSVINGFLNLTFPNTFWVNFLESVAKNPQFGTQAKNGEKVMLEYCSPNTNKPLHLGHIRNILLGWSVSRILETIGYEVIRTEVINDRGIAICKSMLAWQLFGESKTPASTGIKGDHFIGDYYVLFEQKFKQEYALWQTSETAKHIFEQRKKQELTEDDFFKEYKNTYFNEYSELGSEAKKMLLAWEAGDEATIQLWRTMNGWVYEGFDQTFEALGVSFHKVYHESETYILGKDTIMAGLEKGIFYQKDDTSVWIDLADVKLDQKLVLRSDGTSVYITQDIGMAQLREKEFGAKKVVYVVADEQEYHFQVLFQILKKLGEPYANGLHHLSYGMVELPTGRMKSREGTVVDADDLVSEVVRLASENSQERGEVADFTAAQRSEINRRVGIGALKFYMLKVNPKKKMIFDPNESVDLQGHTGPYIQYAFVRANGVIKTAEKEGVDITKSIQVSELATAEKEIMLHLYTYPEMLQQSANTYDPSNVANYCYELAKLFARFWHDLPIFKEKNEDAKILRLKICQAVAQTLTHGFDLLGIQMPERM